MSTRELVVYLKTPDRDPIVGREVTCVLKEPDVFEEKIVQATRPLREVTDSDGRVAFDLIPSMMLDNQTKYLVNWLDLDEPYEISMSEVDSTLATLVGETGTFSRDNLIAGDNITLTFVGNESVRIAFSGQAGGDDEVARAAAEAARAIADAAVVVNTQQTVDIAAVVVVNTQQTIDIAAAKVVADAAVVVNTQQAIDIDAAQAAADGAVAVNVVQQAEIDAISGGGGTIGIDRAEWIDLTAITSGVTSITSEVGVDLLPNDDVEIKAFYSVGGNFTGGAPILCKGRDILDLESIPVATTPTTNVAASVWPMAGPNTALNNHQLGRLSIWLTPVGIKAAMSRGNCAITINRSRPTFVPTVLEKVDHDNS